MSASIDQKVVEMRFDNKQFESNVQTSMSTIEKLKQKLNFNGVSKGFEKINTASKKVDMSGLSKAVETVSVKFSALEVVGATALANLTNSAVNAGKRIISALTIDPVRTGFQEYETQMNAIQTILANTQSKGSTLEDVNAALSELNKYADQTIYNFTEMTRNIGTFTAAGVDLDKSVTSIKGIANLAAVSGSNAQQASTAMYQLSQALAAGKVSLMDWNSVVNAGMGGEVFQTALKRTAEHFGFNVDAMIKKYGSFRESLTEGGWLTAEVLTETLTQLSGAYTEADLIAQGYSKDQAKAIVDLANTAVGAATEVKTFTQLWDTMKEAVQSGWAQSWQIIIGDFEQAKELFSRFSELFGGVIQSISDTRNKILEGALSSNWDRMIKQINEAGVATEDFTAELEKTARASVRNYDEIIKKHGSLAKAFTDGALSSDLIVDTLKRMAGVTGDASKSTEDMTGKLEYFQKVVDEVWNGDYKNGEERIKALADAGYDYAQVQSLVNKTVDGHKLTLEDLSDTQLKSIGYTDEEVKALRELAEQAEKTGTPLNDLIENISKPSGRELLWDSVLNIFQSIIDIGGAVGKAWREIFPPEDRAAALYNLIDGFHAFTENLVVTEDTVDNITRTFKGLFAILDLFTTIVGSGFKVAFKLFNTVLGQFDMGLLDFTAMLGDAAVAIHDFLLENKLITEGFELLASGIRWLIDAIRDLVAMIGDLPMVQNAIASLKDGLSEMQNVGEWAIEGLQNGLKEGLTSIPELLVRIGKALLNAIKGVLGIHSPSTEMEEVGKFSIQGLINGFMDGLSALVNALKSIGAKCVEIIGDIEWGKILAAGISVGLLYVAKELVGAIGAITAPLGGIGDVLSGFGEILEKAAKPIAKVIKSFANVMNSFALSIKANALKNIAIAIGILAASLFLLAQLDVPQLLKAIGALSALAVVIGVLTVAIGKFGPDKAVTFSGFAFALLGISASLLIMASAVKRLESLDPENLGNTMAAFVTILVGMVGTIAAYGTFVTDDASKNISKLGSMMLKLSVSLLLMVGVIKLVSLLDTAELIKGGVAIAAFVLLVKGLVSVTTVGKDTQMVKVSGLLMSMSASLLLMVGVVKLISLLSVGELVKGGAAIAAFVLLVKALVSITTVGKETEIAKVSGLLISMSASLLLMVGVVKAVSLLSVQEMIKGGAAIAAFLLLVKALVSITTIGKDTEIAKVSLVLLSMSVSIGILAGVATLLSLIDLSGLAKGVVAIGALAAIMSMMLIATKEAQDVKGDLIVMTVAIGIMATAIAALSFIDPANLAGATASLAIVMGMFSTVLKSTANVTESIGTLIVMTTAIGILAGIIYLLSSLPVESVLTTAVSLSTLLLSLSASMSILSKVKAIAPSTSLALGAMTLAVGGLAAIMGILDYLNVEPSIQAATALSILLTTMSGVCVILAGVGKIGAGAALQGALALDGVIVVVGGLIAGIGALVAYFPQLEEFVNKGVGLLEAVGRGIGGFVGGIVGGVLSGITSSLPDIATDLSNFMANLTPFLEGAKAVDADSVTAVKSLAEMILLLTAADVVQSITSFFGLSGSLTDFAEQLKPFGEAMAEFGATIKGKIDAESMNAVSNAGKMLAELNKSLPRSGGALQSFLGSQDLGAFSEDMKKFGHAIVEFSNVVAPDGQSKINAAATEAAANAGKMLADLNKSLPKQGGVLQDFLGSQDLGAFSEDMKAFGRAIVNFSETVAPDGQIKVNAAAVEAAANAGQMLSELSNRLPRQGGFLQDFLGSQDLGTFGEQIRLFGQAIVGFSNAIAPGGKVIINEEAVEAAANAGTMMSDLANNLPASGGFLQAFLGDKSMGEFGSELESFGKSLTAYAQSIEGVTPETVTASANAADSLVTLANKLPENKWFSSETTLDDFGKQLSKFGEYFADYYNEISGINIYKLSTVIEEMNNLIDMAKGMSGIDFGSLGSFGKSLKKLGNDGIDEFINAFQNANSRVSQAASDMLATFINAANAKRSDVATFFSNLLTDIVKSIDSNRSKIKMAGEELILELISGATSKKSSAIEAFRDVTVQISTELRKNYLTFRTIGSYLIDGFADGIRANTYKAAERAREMARSARIAAESELDVSSPSKVFFKIGGYVAQGLTNGMDDRIDTVKKSSVNLATALIDTVQDKLGITSPPNVMKDHVGRYIVKGIADGITEDMSAEEAAEQKAQNIVDAFQKRFDAIDSNLETSDLEYQLWEKLNPNATDEEKYDREMAQLQEKLKAQSDTVRLLQAQYMATSQTFGEKSQRTQEAYNKLLQGQIDLAGIVDEINTLQKESVSSTQGTFEDYAAFIQANQQKALELGISIDQLKQMATERTGYDPNPKDVPEDLNAKAIIDEALSGVEVAFKESAKETVQELVTESTEIGSSMATAIGDGMSSKKSEVTENASDMAKSCANKIRETQPQWTEAAVYLVDGFILGIQNNVERAAQAAAAMAIAAYNAAMSAINANSPSKLFEEVGSYVVLGFANGITSGERDIESSMTSMAQAAINNTKNIISNLVDAINADVDTQPTIRPVLDLSDVEAKGTRLNTLFSRSQALRVSSSFNNRAAALNNQNGDVERTESAAPSYQFVQNNYSPKALSRIEIYRQTKNQLSAAERMVKT